MSADQLRRDDERGPAVSDIQYKCPSCSAPIEFDPKSGKMRCEFCGSALEVAEVERFNAAGSASSTTPAGAGAAGAAPRSAPAPGSAEAASSWKSSEATYVDRADMGGMKTLVCDSCGAEIVGDPTTISTRCGFCNNTFIASERIVETRVPDFIVPFAIDKEGMLEAFEKATQGKFLLPKAFRDRHTLSEATGAYIPYWYHDGSASGTLTFQATNTRSWSDSEYDYTETDVYDVTRSASAPFRGLPVCATTKLEPERAEGAEPFDLADSRAFTTPYLSGYAASSYDIEARATLERADQRVKSTLFSMVAGTITGYDSVNPTSSEIRVDRSAVWYALLPIWLIVIGYEGKKYPFAINGQTGEVVGSFPISKPKMRALRAAFTLPFAAAFGALAWFIVQFFL